jgi:hypothetical protein
MPHKTAVPIFDGRLTDEFDEHDEKYVKRYVPRRIQYKGKSVQVE